MATTPQTRRVGPRSPFGPKDLPNRTHSLTKHAKRLLDMAHRRCKTSESNIVELLARRYAADLTADDFAYDFDNDGAAA